MPDACDRRCCCSSHAATARITHTRNACPVSSYVAGKRLEQTLAGHPRIAPSPFAPVGPPHLPLTAVVWCLYRRPAAWATGQPHAKRKVGGAAGSATGALLAPTAPRRVAWLGYVPRAQLWWGGGGIGVCGSSRVRLGLLLLYFTRNDTVSELLRGAPSGAGYATGVVRARTVSRDIWSRVDSGQPPARHLGDHRQQPRAR